MIKLVIFDMDGTVFESYLDWAQIKQTLGVESNILKELYKDGAVDVARMEILEGFEEENTKKTKPIKGIYEYLSYLESCKIKCALITNNNKKNTEFLLNKYRLDFDTVITREQNLWKPEPDAFFYAMNLYRCKVDEVITIGDSHYDVKASQSAGISGIYIINKKKDLPALPSAGDADIINFDDFFHLKELFSNRYHPTGV